MMENYQIMSNVSYFYVPCDSSDIIFWIDLIQHQKFQEKRNPFHGRFTHKKARFWFAKLMII